LAPLWLADALGRDRQAACQRDQVLGLVVLRVVDVDGEGTGRLAGLEADVAAGQRGLHGRGLLRIEARVEQPEVRRAGAVAGVADQPCHEQEPHQQHGLGGRAGGLQLFEQLLEGVSHRFVSSAIRRSSA